MSYTKNDYLDELTEAKKTAARAIRSTIYTVATHISATHPKDSEALVLIADLVENLSDGYDVMIEDIRALRESSPEETD